MQQPAKDPIPEIARGLEERYRAWRDLGRQALDQGDPEEALWCLRRAVELCSDDPGTWQLLGRCFERIGESVRARRCYTVASRQLLRSGRRSLIRGAHGDLAE